MIGRILLFVLALQALALQSWAAATDLAWNNLKHVPRSGFYHFVSRTGQRYAGNIGRVTDDRIVLIEHDTKGKKAPRELQRTDVLEIDDGTAGLLYSGRNTWEEVTALAGTTMLAFNVGKGIFRVATKDGKELSARTIKVTGSDISFEQQGREERVSRMDVARVDYVRAVPWKEGVEFSYQELGPLAIFNPGYWPHMLHMNGEVIVPIYDASLPPDDAPCPYCD